MTCVSAANAGNVAPTIAGSPRAAVTAGRDRSFDTTASHANGDKLTLRRQGPAALGKFQQAHRQHYGRPGAGDVGRSRPISIAVSDGR